MKEIYYTYNNEAIASCVLLSLLQEVNTYDISRCCIVLPFLLDDKTTNQLINQQDLGLTLEEFIKKNPRLFISFNKRYLSLLPVTINSVMLLSKSNCISVSQSITTKKPIFITDDDFGRRFDKIQSAIPFFIKITQPHSTQKLYQLLNIQL